MTKINQKTRKLRKRKRNKVKEEVTKKYKTR